MSTFIKLMCKACQNQIKWPIENEWPDFCPGCGSDMRLPPEQVVLPFVSKASHRGPDRVYAAMEQSSEQNMQAAAEATGLPVSELSDMKVTNMRDNLRAGDTAAMPVNNAVSQMMASTALSATGFQGGMNPQIQSFVQGAKRGPHAGQGTRSIGSLVSKHRNPA